MTASDRAQRYTRVAIVLHWTIAIVIIGQVAAGWWMTSGDGAGAAAPGTLRYAVFQLHKSFGVAVLLLTLARLAWRLFNAPPPLPEHFKPWEKHAAHALHWVFYGLMLALPLTGWALVSSSPTGFATVLFGVVEWPHLPLPAAAALNETFTEAHEILAWIAVAGIALHVAAALKHQILDRTNLLARMAPGLLGPADAPTREPRGLPVAVAAPVALVFVVYAAAVVPFGGREAPLVDAGLASDADEGGMNGPWVWTVDTGASRIGFAGAQYGTPFEGVFERWSAQVRFDPSDLGAARVVATIDTTSAKSGDGVVDGSITSRSWLDADAHPQAMFEATTFRATGEGSYEAEGVLTLKGITQPAVLPFTLVLDDAAARAEGALALDRRAFEIGTDSADNDGAVTPEITVSVVIEAARTP